MSSVAGSTGRGGYLTLPSGLYFGEYDWKRAPHGQGGLLWNSTDLYLGSFREGKLDGKGLLLFASGGLAFGTFSEGFFEGECLLRLGNGDTIVGNFTEGKRDGVCIHYYNSKKVKHFRRYRRGALESVLRVEKGELTEDGARNRSFGLSVRDGGVCEFGFFRRDKLDGFGVRFGEQGRITGRFEAGQVHGLAFSYILSEQFGLLSEHRRDAIVKVLMKTRHAWQNKTETTAAVKPKSSMKDVQPTFAVMDESDAEYIREAMKHSSFPFIMEKRLSDEGGLVLDIRLIASGRQMKLEGTSQQPDGSHALGEFLQSAFVFSKTCETIVEEPTLEVQETEYDEEDDLATNKTRKEEEYPKSEIVTTPKEPFLSARKVLGFGKKYSDGLGTVRKELEDLLVKANKSIGSRKSPNRTLGSLKRDKSPKRCSKERREAPDVRVSSSFNFQSEGSDSAIQIPKGKLCSSRKTIDSKLKSLLAATSSERLKQDPLSTTSKVKSIFDKRRMYKVDEIHSIQTTSHLIDLAKKKVIKIEQTRDSATKLDFHESKNSISAIDVHTSHAEGPIKLSDNTNPDKRQNFTKVSIVFNNIFNTGLSAIEKGKFKNPREKQLYGHEESGSVSEMAPSSQRQIAGKSDAKLNALKRRPSNFEVLSTKGTSSKNQTSHKNHAVEGQKKENNQRELLQISAEINAISKYLPGPNASPMGGRSTIMGELSDHSKNILERKGLTSLYKLLSKPSSGLQRSKKSHQVYKNLNQGDHSSQKSISDMPNLKEDPFGNDRKDSLQYFGSTLLGQVASSGKAYLQPAGEPIKRRHQKNTLSVAQTESYSLATGASPPTKAVLANLFANRSRTPTGFRAKNDQ